MPGTDACFTGMVLSPAAIALGGGVVSCSELSAPLDSMVVSQPRYVGTIGHFICILYTVPIDSIAYGYSYMQCGL